MFIRVQRHEDRKEILVNLAHIWKIEVKYSIPDPETHMGKLTSLKQGLENPQAVRIYTLHVGNEVIRLPTDASDRAVAAVEKIYKETL